jgi:hypothetical protein
MDKEEERAQFSAVSIGWCRKSTPWLILSSAARAAGGHISVRSLRTPELQRALRTKLKRPNQKEVATAASRRLKRVGLIAERVARLTALAGAPQVRARGDSAP